MAQGDASAGGVPGPEMIRLEGVSKRYPDGTVAVHELDLSVARGELVTLVTGGAATPGLADELTHHLRAAHPGLDVVAYDGGPADTPLLVGVE